MDGPYPKDFDWTSYDLPPEHCLICQEDTHVVLYWDSTHPIYHVHERRCSKCGHVISHKTVPKAKTSQGKISNADT